MAPPRLKAMTRTTKPKFGNFVVEFATPGIGHILKAAGCDFVLFDMEHSGFGFETVKSAIRYTEAAQLPTIVRVPSREYNHISRAADMGAEGIMLPMVGSAAEARQIVDSMKYFPEGRRGVALQVAHDRYRPGPLKAKFAAANKRTTLFAQIETAEGVANADKIAALADVDCLWIGHMDLSASLGIPGEFDDPKFHQAVAKVVAAARKHRKSLGRLVATVEQGGNLLPVMRLLGEKSYREQVVPKIRDEIVRSFWIHEFARWSDNYRTEAVAAIQNKIRPFLTSTNIRAIVSQPGRSIDLRQIMDAGQVLIVNLSKGRVGEDNSTLLGALLVTSIQQAAMTRADIPEEQRRDFFLYVDEFQNFTTGSFASVLSEARKFRLALTVAHQYLGQLSEETAGAIWGNVGSIIAFQVGSDDAEAVAQQLSKFPDQVVPENLTGLPKYIAYARLLIDGMPSSPFSMQPLPPPTFTFDAERAEIIRRVARRRFAGDAAVEPAAIAPTGPHSPTPAPTPNVRGYR